METYLQYKREMLCLKFAKNCLKDEKLKKLFPVKKSEHKMKKRNTMKFKTNKTRTERYRKSAIPYMQRLLNKEENLKSSIIKSMT